MLSVNGLSKAYSTTPLFDGVSFSINPGERVGLLGRNGHGKSTMAKIIVGKESADAGDISWPSHYRVGMLSQDFNFTAATVYDHAIDALPLIDDCWKEEYKAAGILEGLGFTEDMYTLPPRDLSGGFQVRLNLAALLLNAPNLLILDEPTNHLDIISIRWLIQFLQSWDDELLLISHDREFTDKVCTHMLGIHRGECLKMKGSTSHYFGFLQEQEETHERTRVNQEKKAAELERFVERFRAKASKATQAQSKLKQLEKMDRLDKLESISTLSFSFPEREFRGKWLLHCKDLTFGYEPQRTLIEQLNFSLQPGKRLAIIGKNGTGKSTLLRLLAGMLTPQEGGVEPADNCEIGYFGQAHQEIFNPNDTVEETVWAANSELSRTAVRSICGAMHFSGDTAEKKVRVLSGGERARVQLGTILARETTLLLLDEPTHHLDMESCDALLGALNRYSGSLIVVSHEERFIRALADSLIVFHDERAFFFDGNYDSFLEKLGWGDQARPSSPTNDKSADKKKIEKPAVNNKEARQHRARITREFNKKLNPLKKKLEAAEELVISLEAKNEAYVQRLEGNGPLTCTSEEAAKKIAEIAEQIELHFEEMEALGEQIAELEAAMATDLEPYGG